MTELFDADLRSALALKVETIPDEVVERLSGAAYRPRVRRRRVTVAAGGGGVAAVAAIVTVTLGVFGPGVQNAFASWTAAPTPHSTTQISEAETACSMAYAFLTSHDTTTPTFPPITVGTPGINPVVDDVRGPFTLIVFAGASGTSHVQASCLTGGSSWPAGPQISASSVDGDSAVGVTSLGALGPGNSVGQGSETLGYGRGSSDNMGAAPAADQVTGASTNWNSVSNDEVAFGRAGSDVTGVTLQLSDGTSVVTTLANGYYAAWWPGDATITSSNVSTAASS